MDSNQMLERLDEQEKEAEEAREAKAERLKEKEENKRAKLALAEEKKTVREAQINLERPVTTLLQTLAYTDKQSDEVSAKELSAFARANRVQLVEIGVGLTSLARKDLMPEMVHKLGTLMPHVQWTPAPPKALPAPRAELQAAPAAAPAAAELLALPAPAGEPAAPAPVETAAATRSKRQRTTQNA